MWRAVCSGPGSCPNIKSKSFTSGLNSVQVKKRQVVPVTFNTKARDLLVTVSGSLQLRQVLFSHLMKYSLSLDVLHHSSHESHTELFFTSSGPSFSWLIFQLPVRAEPCWIDRAALNNSSSLITHRFPDHFIRSSHHLCSCLYCW